MFVFHFGIVQRSYFRGAIASGLLRLDDQVVEPTHVLRAGSILTHKVLQIEPLTFVSAPAAAAAAPVLQPRPALASDSAPTTLAGLGFVRTSCHFEVRFIPEHSVLLVNKPAGIPVYVRYLQHAFM